MDAHPCEQEQGPVAWELSKENVQPVRSGRDVHCIQAVLEPSEEDMIRLMKEKQQFEEEIIAGESSDDPIAPWDRYLDWTIQNFPTGRNKKVISSFLMKYIDKFKKGGKYNDDARYVKAWLKLAEIVDDSLELFSFMNTEGIGRKCAIFYITWAEEYEKYRDFKKAERIYSDGASKNAHPMELLQKKHVEFQMRVARGVLDNDDKVPEDSDSRFAFGQLDGRGKHNTVGSVRNPSVFKPLHNHNPDWKKQPSTSNKSFDFEIFEDKSDKKTIMGVTGKWAAAPSNLATKENTLNPSTWSSGLDKRKKIRPSVVPQPSQSDFEIYVDCENSVESNPHQSKLPTANKVLTEKKENQFDFSQVKSALNEMPVHDDRFRSYYDVEKVYTVMGEMQFEEVRAAFWRKKQRIIAEQEYQLQQRRLEEQRAQLMMHEKRKMEEERRLMKERVEMMEMERKLIEKERMKICQKKIDLENRMKEIKLLEKTATTAEELEDLQRESEDITMQLNFVKSSLCRVPEKLETVCCNTAKNENSLHCDKLPGVKNSDFKIFDECSAPNANNKEVQSIFVSGAKNVITTGNNSLNQSRRSQPSPTVCTKEALGEVNAWFQESLNDEFEDSEQVFISKNSKIEQKSYSTSYKPSLAQNNGGNENAVPFEIFVDKENCMPQSSKSGKKKGLSQRDSVSVAVGGESENNVVKESVPDADISQTDSVFLSVNEASENSIEESVPDLYVSRKESVSMKVAERSDNLVEKSVPDTYDKTESVFDDMTVAGSHFAARARMASTPYAKMNKLQDSVQMGQISYIHAESEECHPVKTELGASRVEVKKELSRSDGDMYCTVENPAETQQVKQLSPILEDSKECEKSSISKISKKEADTGTFIKSETYNIEQERSVPPFKLPDTADSTNRSHFSPDSDDLSHANDTQVRDIGSTKTMNEEKDMGSSSKVKEKSLLQLKSDPVLYTSGTMYGVNPIDEENEFDSIADLSLWDPMKQIDNINVAGLPVYCHSRNGIEDNLNRSALPPSPQKTLQTLAVVDESNLFFDEYDSDPSFSNSFWKHCNDDDEEISRIQNDIENVCSLLQPGELTAQLESIIKNPWDDHLHRSILDKKSDCESFCFPVIHCHENLTQKPKKDSLLNLQGDEYKVGDLIGEGAFAKVFKLKYQGKAEMVLKAQYPRCPWEVYAISSAKCRLTSCGLTDVAKAIVDVYAAYFYQNCSLLLLPLYEKGTLLDAINMSKGILCNEVAVWLACEIMNIVHSLHTVGIIHGDIKPDNFMLVSGGTLNSGCRTAIKLIDFGRAIDMTEMPKNAMFLENCDTSGFSCIQMKNSQPWNYHIDYYGIAGTLHVVLLKSYMKVRQLADGQWDIVDKLKRWHSEPFWKNFFKTLLNHPTPSKDKPITLEDSPLPRLLEETRILLNQSAKCVSKVNEYFKVLN